MACVPDNLISHKKIRGMGTKLKKDNKRLARKNLKKEITLSFNPNTIFNKLRCPKSSKWKKKTWKTEENHAL